MATTGAAPFTLPAPQLSDQADIEQAIVPLRDRLQTVLASQVPVGAMMMWMTDIAPLWWLLCNGQNVDATQYPRLVSILGETAGRVYLPDLRNRVPLGSSPTRALKSTGGAEAVTLTAQQSGMPLHAHTAGSLYANNNSANEPGWNHPVGNSSFGGYLVPPGEGHGAGLAVFGQGNLLFWSSGIHGHSISGTTDQSQMNAAASHENLQPYLTVNYIIRAE